MAKKYETETPTKLEVLDTPAKSESDNLLEDFRIGLIQLGLKGISDINNKRVQNPTEMYNSLTALYNAVKN